MNLKKFTLALVVVGGCTLPVMAGHGHHHKENDGVRLAAEIIGLVGAVLNPQPTVVVAPPVVAPAPVVVAPPPPPIVVPAPPPVIIHRHAPPPRRIHHPHHHRRR